MSRSMQRQRTRILILLVDDSPTQAQRATIALESAGFRVQLAGNGREALTQAHRWLPDLIISDILMPIMDGFALCREVRRDPLLSQTPLVLQTNTFLEHQDEAFALALGATRYVLKPAASAELVGLVQEVLQAAQTTADATPAIDDATFMAAYSERLINKLEQQVRELESANLQLIQQNSEIVAARDRLEQLLEERKRADAALQASESYFRAAVEGSLADFFIFQSVRDDSDTIVDFTFVELNSRGERFVGIPRDQTIGRRLGELLPAVYNNGTFDKYAHVTASRNPLEEEIQIESSGGTTVWLYRQIIPLADGVAVTSTDVTERKLFEAQLAHQAFHDPLTALPNRTLFMERLGRALIRARHHEEACATLFLDLDRFKVVNDSLGHDMGDQLLIAVGQRLATCLHRSTSNIQTKDHGFSFSTLARLGGDEFGILLEDISHVDAAIRIAECIIQQLRASFTIGTHEIFITPSIGVALSLDIHLRPEELLRDADVAMYRAKNKGRARYEVFDTSMNVRALERLELETDLRLALDRGEFFIHYQPIIALTTRKMVRLEALVRWKHPTRGLIPPGDFIPLAEETGLIRPIGRWMLKQACLQARACQDMFPDNPPLVMCVNLSAREFQEPFLVEEICAVLQEIDLDPHLLMLEITESAAMHDAEATIEILQALRKAGIQTAIDDFGTGYSSLGYLKRFPVDMLKIDRAFVGSTGDDISDLAIVRTAITLAHALGIRVTAEGVETATQLEQLAALGCDSAQGFYLDRPLPSENIIAYLASNRQW